VGQKQVIIFPEPED